MIRITFTAMASAAALLVVSDTWDLPMAMADTVRGALCELSRHDESIPMEDFTCSFTQMQGNVYIDSNRWAFKFPYAEDGKTYQRLDTVDFKRFTREGQYILTVFESGEKPSEPGDF